RSTIDAATMNCKTTKPSAIVAARATVRDSSRLRQKPRTTPIRCNKRRNASKRCVSCTCRSEEHTSELQSPCNVVCRLLLERQNVRGGRRVIAYCRRQLGSGQPRFGALIDIGFDSQASSVQSVVYLAHFCRLLVVCASLALP